MTHVKTSLFLAVLFFVSSFGARAQSPCYSVSGEPIAPSIQYGPYNYFGVRVMIAQSHYEDITVTGTIQEEGGNASRGFTLTIYQGQTSAETDVYYLQTGPASSAGVTIQSVSSCPTAPNQQVVAIHSNVGQAYSGLEHVFPALFTREKVKR